MPLRSALSEGMWALARARIPSDTVLRERKKALTEEPPLDS